MGDGVSESILKLVVLEKEIENISVSFTMIINKARAYFEQLNTSPYKIDEGVLFYDSGVNGECVGITVCTHGNEIAGLYLIPYILDKVKSITSGSLYFIVNNYKATEKFLYENEKNDPLLYRFIDINMNRLPEFLLERANTEYECVRAKNLIKYWKNFDIAIDVHSAYGKNPFIVSTKKHAIIDAMPVKNVILGITEIQKGKPAISFYGNENSFCFGVETGEHTDEESFINAIKCCTVLLSKITDTPSIAKSEKEYFNVTQSVILPDTKFSLIRYFNDFEKIEEGSNIAKHDENNEVIQSNEDFYTLLCYPLLKPKYINDEVLFLMKKMPTE